MPKLSDIQGKCNASALRHVHVSWAELARVLGDEDLSQLMAATRPDRIDSGHESVGLDLSGDLRD